MSAPVFEARCQVEGFESHMKIVVPQDSDVELEQNGVPVRVAPGHAALLPLSSPFRIGGRGRIFQWRLPTAILSRRHAHLSLSELRVIRGSSAPDRLLARLLGSFAEDFTELSNDQKRTAVTTLVEALGLLEPTAPTDSDQKRLTMALSYIQLHLHSAHLDVEQVASAQGVSRRYLDAVFKRKGKRSVSDAIRTLRLERAMGVLRSDLDVAVLPLALSLGFENASHFARRFRQHTQMTPSAFRAKARGRS